jgi:hypothetical protein
LAQDAEAEAVASDLDVGLRGAIVLAGYCSDPDVLRTAEGLPLRGLIMSGMDARLVPVASRLSIPVIVLEGFGRRAHHPAAFKLLSTNDGRPAAANAEAWNVYEGKRPEVVIPLPVPGSVTAPPETAALTPNTTVQILRPPAQGESGQVVRVRGNVVLPSGVRTRAAEVRLENGQTVLVPLANLAVIA